MNAPPPVGRDRSGGDGAVVSDRWRHDDRVRPAAPRQRDDRDVLRAEWRLLAGSFVGIGLGAWALPFYVLGPLIGRMEAAQGWSADTSFGAASALSLGVMLASPVVGRLADRFDARRIAVASLLMLAGCFTSFSWASSAWHAQLIYFLVGLLGAGSGGIIYTRLIGLRFVGARGAALGIALSGTGVASMVAPLLVHAVAENAGWQAVGLAIAVIMVAVGIPIVWFGLEPRTEDRGVARTADGPPGVPLAAAVRTVAFGLIALSVILFGLFISSLVINIVPALVERGLSSAQASQFAASLGVAIIVGRLLVGVLLDRVEPTLVGAGVFGVGALSAWLFLASGDYGALLAIGTLGLLIGAEIDLMSFLIFRYFGTRAYGAIFGAIFSVYTVTTFVGPLLGLAIVRHGGLPLLYTCALGSFALATGVMLALRRARPWPGR